MAKPKTTLAYYPKPKTKGKNDFGEKLALGKALYTKIGIILYQNRYNIYWWHYGAKPLAEEEQY